ncbi:hypothetical protein NCS52_00171100 [Fusarium sp. LHS14.1]|nr:hypothetical protein NCS52_00171100 [Fusarium sp. LHS14.1]
MPTPVLVQVPRPGRSRSSLTHQSNAYSSAINTWLGECETDTPWHNLSLIVVSSTSQDASHTNLSRLPSDNAATQGSAKHGDSVTVRSTTHIQDTNSSNVHIHPPPKSVPANTQQQEPTNTSRVPGGN